MESHDELHLMDLAQRLYALICDKHCLIDAVNKRGVPVVFVVKGQMALPSHWFPHLTMHSIEDSLDPETPIGRERITRIELDRSGFLNFPTAHLHGQPIAVKHVIGYARNVAGGTHYDPREQHREFGLIGQAREFHLGGLPFGVRQLQAIGRVTMRALEPLILEVAVRLKAEGW